MADMTALRDKISHASSTVHDIDTNPSTPERALQSTRKAKAALKEIVDILDEIATFLESK